MDFAAVDVETANGEFSSICQIGIAIFKNGQISHRIKHLVNPESYFSGVNVSIHGITEEMVQNAPLWCDIHEEINSLLNGQIVACHTQFDRISTSRASEAYGLTPWSCRWLDTAKVVRRSWPEFAQRGYGLPNVARHLNISYQAHDALEDAICAGYVLLAAIEKTGISLEQWLERTPRGLRSGSGGISTRKIQVDHYAENL